MKKIFQLTIVLLIIGTFSGLVLSVVNSLTKDTIASAQEKKLNDGIRENIFSNINSKTDVAVSDKYILAIYEVKDSSDKVVGHVFKINAPGSYSGTLIYLVGINTEGKVVGLSFLNVKETVSTGDKVMLPNFYEQFIGKDNTSGVDTISGATYSSRAVIKGVNYCLNYYNNNLKK